MMLLALISPMELLLLAGAGWLVLRLFGRRHGGSSGGNLKFLGIVAVVAGLAFIVARSSHTPRVEESTVVRVESDTAMPWHDLESTVVETHGPDRWVFVVLGTALVILGVLVFGRGGPRPLAVRAVTLLGVGAILYAVVTFFGQPPRTAPRAVRRVSHVSSHEIHHGPWAPGVQHPTQHARRPALRPSRPANGTTTADEFALPERAGEIPVWTELARAAAVAGEPIEPNEPEPAAQPQTTETAADDAPPVKPAPADAQAQEVEEPAVEEKLVEEVEESEAAAAPVEPARPSAAASAKPAARAKQVARHETADAGPPSELPKPAWVDAKAGLARNGVYAVTVHSGWFVTVPECQREVELAIKRTADQYIEDYLGAGAAEVVDLPLTYLNEHVRKSAYAELSESKSVGPMHQIHALLEFDNPVRAELHQRQRNAEIANRLWYTAGGAALVLSLLGIVYGYLRLDLRTGGAHKSALQLAATLVGLIMVAGLLLVRWAVPF